MLIEAKTYRFRGHSVADPGKYRSKEEVRKWMERDPISILGTRIRTLGIATEAQLREIDTAVKSEVQEAVAFAEAAPFPDPKELHRYVYAEA